jgi:hypothetical protein
MTMRGSDAALTCNERKREDARRTSFVWLSIELFCNTEAIINRKVTIVRNCVCEEPHRFLTFGLTLRGRIDVILRMDTSYF